MGGNHKIWRNSAKGYTFAFLSTILFSLSIPFNKILLVNIQPITLSGFLYFFSGLVFLPSFKLQKKFEKIKKKDLKYLIFMILFGAILAPIILFYGLKTVSALQTSLFLNFELIFSTLLAILIFHDKIGKNAIIGFVIIVIVLFLWSIDFNFSLLFSSNYPFGVIFVIIACFFWGMDNNLSQRLSNKSSVQIASIKSLIGGLTNILISFILKYKFKITFMQVALILFVGLLSYGLSIVFFLNSLKILGTSKTGIIFSLNSFIAGIFSILITGDKFSLNIVFVFAFVLFGVALILVDHHKHRHFHPNFIHSHPIEDDLHHQPSMIERLEKNGQIVTHQHLSFEHSHDHHHDLHHIHKHKKLKK